MPDFIKIKIRRGTTADWASSDPVLADGEIAVDKDKHGLKVGNGTSRWSALPFCSAEVVNDLITGGADKALSAEQGKELKEQIDDKANKSDVTILEAAVQNIIATGGVEVVDNLNDTSPFKALSANQGRLLGQKVASLEAGAGSNVPEIADDLVTDDASKVLSAKQGVVLKGQIDDMSVFGIGYTVDTYNSQSKPTQITFDDGVTATLNWSGTKLQSIVASTGEFISITYDQLGRVKGRTVGVV